MMSALKITAALLVIASIPFAASAHKQYPRPYVPEVHEGNTHIIYVPAIDYDFPDFFFDQPSWDQYRFSNYYVPGAENQRRVVNYHYPTAQSNVYTKVTVESVSPQTEPIRVQVKETFR